MNGRNRRARAAPLKRPGAHAQNEGRITEVGAKAAAADSRLRPPMRPPSRRTPAANVGTEANTRIRRDRRSQQAPRHEVVLRRGSGQHPSLARPRCRTKPSRRSTRWSPNGRRPEDTCTSRSEATPTTSVPTSASTGRSDRNAPKPCSATSTSNARFPLHKMNVISYGERSRSRQKQDEAGRAQNRRVVIESARVTPATPREGASRPLADHNPTRGVFNSLDPFSTLGIKTRVFDYGVAR